MAKMASGPRQAEWEDYMALFQQCEPGQRSDEKWKMMEQCSTSTTNSEQRK